MKLKKRSEGCGEETAPQQSASGQKPVFLYILILFAVAFALILMSFIMHQRSNQQVLGELHSNVNALEELQEVLDENVRLQTQLSESQKQLAALQQEKETLQGSLSDANANAAEQQARLAAMDALFVLQQQYAAKEYDSCRETLSAMESSGYDKLLEDETLADGVTTPAQRYQQLYEAISSK